MTEKVDWDNLPTAIDTWVITTKKLPEGLYACPRCEGTGRIEVGHADPGPNPTTYCGMCNGTRAIKRCKGCRDNPIPANSISSLCNECEVKAMQHVLDLEKRTEITCIFPIGICEHPKFQECNSDGKLVCDLKGCEYAILPLAVYPEECIVRKVKGEEYCKTCVDRENCPWKNREEN